MSERISTRGVHSLEEEQDDVLLKQIPHVLVEDSVLRFCEGPLNRSHNETPTTWKIYLDNSQVLKEALSRQKSPHGQGPMEAPLKKESSP